MNGLYWALLGAMIILNIYLLYRRYRDKKTFVSGDELITSKAQLEEAVRKQDLALRSINFGLVYIDKDFRVQWETTTSIQQLVAKHRYVPGQLCYETTLLEKEACVDCPFKAAVKAGKMQIRLVHVESMTFEISATPVYDNGGKELIGGLLRIEDVSEKLRVSQMLQDAKEKAEESNRLKSAFLANISHEIRTPLNTILGFSDMICRADDEESKQEFMGIIETNSALLLQLIDDILDLSKIEAGKMGFAYTEVDLNEMMEGILTQAKLKNKSPEINIRFIEKLPECTIQTDSVRLSQIIVNLLGNALKFTAAGIITIGYRLEKETNQLYFFVEDTGIGIPKEKQDIIFDRFIKLDTFVPGTGLGLSISRAIVENFGGEMGVESQEGKGSCFWFRIPAKLVSKRLFS